MPEARPAARAARWCCATALLIGALAASSAAAGAEMRLERSARLYPSEQPYALATDAANLLCFADVQPSCRGASTLPATDRIELILSNRNLCERLRPRLRVCTLSSEIRGTTFRIGQTSSGQSPPDLSGSVLDRALIVVLDASGSMKESVVGGVKSDLAQRGLLATLSRLPAGTGVGLRLLGEAEDEDDDECVASRRAIPFAEFEADRWKAAFNAIRWDGTTPLSHSIREAFADLRGVQARRKEILLISDGEDTCGGDPIGTARHEAEGVRIHTISLGERVSDQLAGIALVTGGTYSIAFDNNTFEEATADSLPELPGGLPDAENSPGSSGGGVLEVILDVSNSMWGHVEGRAKMDLARSSLAGALADLPADVPVGLRAYGHRVSYEDKERGCEDTELLIAPVAGAAQRVVAAAAALAPRGQTPIAYSLRAAADDLRSAGGAGTLLLISDGIESCGGDPVAVAEELRASGLQVVIHTVGLGVDAEAAAALSDLATAGGGDYFDAPTAEQLMRGVEVAVRSSREFILSEQQLSSFPSPVERVQGGNSVDDAEILEAGYYSFREHLFRDQRYFAVRGTPGETITLAGLVCALNIGRTRDGTVTYPGNRGMMFAERLDGAGEKLRGRSLIIRGDMGEWSELPIVIQDDGYARFRIGRPLGNVHRDMLFEIRR